MEYTYSKNKNIVTISRKNALMPVVAHEMSEASPPLKRTGMNRKSAKIAIAAENIGIKMSGKKLNMKNAQNPMQSEQRA